MHWIYHPSDTKFAWPWYIHTKFIKKLLFAVPEIDLCQRFLKKFRIPWWRRKLQSWIVVANIPRVAQTTTVLTLPQRCSWVQFLLICPRILSLSGCQGSSRCSCHRWNFFFWLGPATGGVKFTARIGNAVFYYRRKLIRKACQAHQTKRCFHWFATKFSLRTENALQ